MHENQVLDLHSTSNTAALDVWFYHFRGPVAITTRVCALVHKCSTNCETPVYVFFGYDSSV